MLEKAPPEKAGPITATLIRIGITHTVRFSYFFMLLCTLANSSASSATFVYELMS